jgi:hypothetical protein
MRNFIFLFVFGVFGLLLSGTAVAQNMDICLQVNGNTITVYYVPLVNYSVPPQNFWSAQTVTFRYPTTSPLSFSNFQTLQFNYGDNPLTAGPGLNGGNGYYYKNFANPGNFTALSFTAGVPVAVFSIDVTVNDCSGGAVDIELITGDAVTFANGFDATVDWLGGLPTNQFNSFGSCGNSLAFADNSIDVCMKAVGNTIELKYIANKDYNTGNDIFWSSQVMTMRYPSTANIDFTNFSNLTTLGFVEDPLTMGPGLNGGDGFFYKVFSNDGSVKTLSMNLGDTLTVLTVDVLINSGSSVPFQMITGNAWTTTNNANATAQNVGVGGNAFCQFVICGDTVVTKRSMEVCLEAVGSTISLKYIPGANHLVNPENQWGSQVLTIRYPSSDVVTFSGFANNPSYNYGYVEDTSTPGPGVDGGDGYTYKVFSNDGSLKTVNMALGDTNVVLTIDVTVISGGDVPFELISGNAWTMGNNADATIQNIGGSGNIFQQFVDCGNEVFPVEILGFTAEKVDAGIMLDWVTVTEINNDYFQIQRSYDADVFEAIGQVKGAGNSNSVLTYQFLDNTYTSNKIFYRLKQYDFDGSFTYSNIVEITFEESDMIKMNVFPNPASEMVNVVVPGMKGGTYHVVVHDMSGRLVHKDLLNPVTGTMELNVSNWANGIYIVQLADQFGNVKNRSKLFKE